MSEGECLVSRVIILRSRGRSDIRTIPAKNARRVFGQTDSGINCPALEMISRPGVLFVPNCGTVAPDV